MFGDPLTNPKKWRIKTIGELCEVSRGASPRPITDYMGGSVPWIKIGDGSSSGPYLSSTAEFVTEEGAAKSVFVPPGSLIVANSGVSCGFARILKIGGCIHDGWLALLNICKDLEPLYLLAFINLMTLELRRRAPGGTQPNLNTALMKSVKLPLPPLTLQENFSKKFAELFTLRTQQQDAANSIESLFATMLHRAFTGELTAKWREAHLKELLVEMEHQAKLLRTAAETN
jgi:type I restriction enzyme S subunit